MAAVDVTRGQGYVAMDLVTGLACWVDCCPSVAVQVDPKRDEWSLHWKEIELVEN